ncbi:type II toxin-antitoxin system RelE/ParE family toxin [Rudaea sp.]|uniref:type II toxin-antitoxin system RelE/ParE family toxin n=1 Tax=Rudaea sp. TaxID=2136325 RepID=UPI0039E671A1
MIVDTFPMFELRKTNEFNTWFDGLRDERAQATITNRLIRAELGHLGDAKFFDGIGELRIDYGPGYRLYFTRRKKVVVIPALRRRQIHAETGHPESQKTGGNSLGMV